MYVTLAEKEKTTPNLSHPKQHLQKSLNLFRYFIREEERGGRKEGRLGKESKFKQLLTPEEDWGWGGRGGEPGLSQQADKLRAGRHRETQRRLLFSRRGERGASPGPGYGDPGRAYRTAGGCPLSEPCWRQATSAGLEPLSGAGAALRGCRCWSRCLRCWSRCPRCGSRCPGCGSRLPGCQATRPGRQAHCPAVPWLSALTAPG